MKTKTRLIALIAGVLVSQLCVAQAPAGAPSGATGQCNDGTYSTAATKKGACRGHKGVKEWYIAASAQSAKTTGSFNAKFCHFGTGAFFDSSTHTESKN